MCVCCIQKIFGWLFFFVWVGFWGEDRLLGLLVLFPFVFFRVLGQMGKLLK